MTAQEHDHFLLDGSDYEIVGVSGRGWFEPERYGLHPSGHFLSTACWRNYVATYALQGTQLVLDELGINLQSPEEGAVDGEFPPALNGVRPWQPWEYWSMWHHPDLRKIKAWIDMQAAEARRLGLPPDFAEHLQPGLEAIRSWPGLEAELRAMLGIDLADPYTQKALHCFGEDIYEDIGLELEFTGRLLLGQGFIRELYVHMGFQRPWKYEKVLELRFYRGLLLRSRDVSEAMRRRREILRRLPLEPSPGGSLPVLARWIQSTANLDHTSLGWRDARWLAAAVLWRARRRILTSLARWLSPNAPPPPR